MRIDVFHHTHPNGPDREILAALKAMEDRIMAAFDDITALQTTEGEKIDAVAALLQSLLSQGLSPAQVDAVKIKEQENLAKLTALVP